MQATIGLAELTHLTQGQPMVIERVSVSASPKKTSQSKAASSCPSSPV
ncbi:MAG: hypothetical protein ABSF98_06105 [Bryobacteraceae bacterium]